MDRRTFLRVLFAPAPLVFTLGCQPFRSGANVSPLVGPAQRPVTNESPNAAAARPSLALTPACADAADPTPPQTAGPFFTPNSPQRTSLLEPGMPGAKIVLGGFVLDTGCQPIAGALLDFWHADDSGAYDNVGFGLRGHQFADDNGQYSLETIVPGLYTGRTRHFHVRVQAPNSPVLTTQLYFPGEPRNARDGIFNPALVLAVQDAEDGKLGSFDFVLS